MHDKQCDLVEEAGGQLEGIYYCPHAPEDNCHCRKPATGLIEEMLLDYDLDLSNTVIVGDSLRDLEAGVAMGCTPILVHTGKGLSTAATLQENSAAWHAQVAQYEDLASVADMLIAETRI
jgi:D-glycero-D-manno-heptose 1,7-bisphosphate phosphatase